MNYKIGCNYWGSKYGTDMWKHWDEASVREDLALLRQYGVTHMRVFPNWRDFQPIHLLQNWCGNTQDYRFADDVKLDNEYGLDMACIKRFHTFCRIAQENGIQLTVAIVTGWMSGRMFVPPALERLNHVCDAESLMWQNRFVRGFVKHLKEEPAIACWDLGNACNNLGPCTSRAQAYLWAANVRDAILSEDASRPIMSGMHNLGIYFDSVWSIQDQAELTDVLTPHPYPSPTVGGDLEPMTGLRTTLIPTAQVALYAGVGRKPAMMQEVGTFNNIVGNEQAAADNLRVNILSGWANGSLGYLWWCGHDQKHLKHPPYSLSMNENELGLLREDRSPKKNALEMKRLTEALRAMPLDDLPAAQMDAVCLIPNGLPKYFYTAQAAYILGKQAGINMTFTTCTQELPDAAVYIVPSLMGWSPITQEIYLKLMEKAEAGSSVYFSSGTGFLTDIEDVLGLESLGMVQSSSRQTANFEGCELPFAYDKKFLLRSVGAEVLCAEEDGTVIFSRMPRGRGEVFFLNFPLETMVWNTTEGFTAHPYFRIYQTVAQRVLEKKCVRSLLPDVALTIHPVDAEHSVIVAINYADCPHALQLAFCASGTQMEPWKYREPLKNSDRMNRILPLFFSGSYILYCTFRSSKRASPSPCA